MDFDISTPSPVARIDLELEGSGDKPFISYYPREPENYHDGRVSRSIGYKPGVSGTWVLVVSVYDLDNRWATARCESVLVTQ